MEEDEEEECAATISPLHNARADAISACWRGRGSHHAQARAKQRAANDVGGSIEHDHGGRQMCVHKALTLGSLLCSHV